MSTPAYQSPEPAIPESASIALGIPNARNGEGFRMPAIAGRA